MEFNLDGTVKNFGDLIRMPKVLRGMYKNNLERIMEENEWEHRKTKRKKILTSRMTYVYLLSSNGRYKIGRAKDVEKRLSAIRTSNPDPVIHIASKLFEDGYAMEKDFHRKYDRYKVRDNGEWFDLPTDKLEEIKRALS